MCRVVILTRRGRQYPARLQHAQFFAVAAAKDCEVHHVDVKTAFPQRQDGKGDKHQAYRRHRAGGGRRGPSYQLSSVQEKAGGPSVGHQVRKRAQGYGGGPVHGGPVPLHVEPPSARACQILLYVEDLIVAGKGLDGVQAVKNSVSATFNVRDKEEVNNFICIKIMRDRAAKMLTLSNPGHVIALLEAFGISNSTPNKTPMVSGAKLAKTGENLLPDGNR